MELVGDVPRYLGCGYSYILASSIFDVAKSISAGHVGYIRLFDRSVWLSNDAQVQREKTKTRGFRLTRIYWKLQARASVFAQKRNKSYVLEYDIINTHLTSPPSSYTK